MEMDQYLSELKAIDNEARVAEELSSSKKESFSSYPKKINQGKQGKHIPGHNNYSEGKSTLTVSMNEAQELVNQHSGKGQKISETKERVDFGKNIGLYVDPENGTLHSTTIGIIHYSKATPHKIET